MKRKLLNLVRDVQNEVFSRFEQFESESGSKPDGQSEEKTSTCHRAPPVPEKHSSKAPNTSTMKDILDTKEQRTPTFVPDQISAEPSIFCGNLHEDFPSPALPRHVAPLDGSLGLTSQRESRNGLLLQTDTTDQNSYQRFVQDWEEQLDLGTEFADLTENFSGYCSTSTPLSFPIGFDTTSDGSSDIDWSFTFHLDCNEWPEATMQCFNLAESPLVNLQIFTTFPRCGC